MVLIFQRHNYKMLYQLFKKVYASSRERKEYANDNWDKIILCLKDKKKKKKKKIPLIINTNQAGVEPEWYDLYVGRDSSPYYHDLAGANQKSKRTIASKVFDPETSEQMIKLVNLMEKFISLDHDVSYKNLCLFVNPLSYGSKKILIRPHKVVGLIRKLENITRCFERALKSENKEREVQEVRQRFFDCLREIKQRLSNTKINKKKSQNINWKTSVSNLIQNSPPETWTKEAIKTLLSSPDFAVSKEETDKVLNDLF